MAIYIDADKLKQDLVDLYDFAKWDPREIHFSLFDMVANIDGEPTADVAPVIHAYWKLNGNKNHDFCTYCGALAPLWFDDDGERIEWLSDYCPNCGAKMDEVVQ